MAFRVVRGFTSILAGQMTRQQALRTSLTNTTTLKACVRSLSISPRLADRLYTKDHEWVVVSDGVGKVGITAYAQEKLGEIVYCEVPGVGDDVEKDEPCGAVESVKAASDLISPVTGEVLEINDALEDTPNLVNKHPYDEGWMFTVKLEDEGELAELLDDAAYLEFCESEE